MKTDAPKVIKLSEYKQPDYLVQTIDLVFHLDSTQTLVQSKMTITKNNNEGAPLVLNGEELTLKSVKINGETFTDYKHDEEAHTLTLNRVPAANFTLEIENVINPEATRLLMDFINQEQSFVLKMSRKDLEESLFMLTVRTTWQSSRQKLLLIKNYIQFCCLTVTQSLKVTWMAGSIL